MERIKNDPRFFFEQVDAVYLEIYGVPLRFDLQAIEFFPDGNEIKKVAEARLEFFIQEVF